MRSTRAYNAGDAWKPMNIKAGAECPERVAAERGEEIDTFLANNLPANHGNRAQV